MRRSEPQTSAELARVTFTDLRTLQTFVDKGLHSIHVLGLNCDVLQVMLEDCSKIKLLEEQIQNGELQRYHEFQGVIQARHREQLFCKKSLQSICDRAERISRMVSFPVICELYVLCTCSYWHFVLLITFIITRLDRKYHCVTRQLYYEGAHRDFWKGGCPNSCPD